MHAISKESRSNSMIFEQRGQYNKNKRTEEKKKYCSNGIWNSKIDISDPDSFVYKTPMVMIPTSEWSDINRKTTQTSLNNVIIRLERTIKEESDKTGELKALLCSLKSERKQLKQQKLSFRGRGLKENRNLLFLLQYLHAMKMKKTNKQLRHIENIQIHMNSMIKHIKLINQYSGIFYSVDIDGFLNAIPDIKAEMSSLSRRIEILEKKALKPKHPPIPTSFSDQLIYPTSTTLPIFISLQSCVHTKTIPQVFQEFREMTDDNDEFYILIDHAFTFAWQSCSYPFISNDIPDIPLFTDARVSYFDPDYIPDVFLETQIGNIDLIEWPFRSVIEILLSIHFEINPVLMAKKFYDALHETAKCVTTNTGKPIDVDFDTLFPLILINVLASGIAANKYILPYIASLSTIPLSNTYCKLGASYAEAVLQHLFSV